MNQNISKQVIKNEKVIFKVKKKNEIDVLKEAKRRDQRGCPNWRQVTDRVGNSGGFFFFFLKKRKEKKDKI